MVNRVFAIMFDRLASNNNIKDSMNIDRVNSELCHQISMIVLHELSDPRVDGSLLTVMEVRTTADLKYAKVFVSYMGDADRSAEVFDGLNSSANYIRQLLKSRVKIRTLPALTFVQDTSIAYAAHMNEVIAKATATIRTEEDDDATD